MRLFIFLISTILLSGCVSSSYVSAIGAKTMHGNTKKDSTEINLIYSDRLADEAGFMSGDFLPYTNLYIDSEGWGTATVSFNYADITWNNQGEGSINLMVNGEEIEFLADKFHDQVELIHDYRNWYSYPAQSLLVLSIPADVVITAVAVPVIGAGMLFVGLTMEPPMH